MLLLCQKEGAGTVRKIIFLVILCAAACQDMKNRSLDGRFLLACTGMGAVIRAIEGCVWTEVLCSAVVGLLFLAAGRLTSGGIGEGDGWFFMITGLLLEPRENVMLAVAGISLCFLFCLTLLARSIRDGRSVGKKKLPFLPFVLPGGIWIALH